MSKYQYPVPQIKHNKDFFKILTWLYGICPKALNAQESVDLQLTACPRKECTYLNKSFSTPFMNIFTI